MAVSAEIQEKMLEEAISATPTFQVDTNDPQFKEIEDYYDQKEIDVNTTYGDMIANNPYNGWDEKLEANRQQQEQVANDRLNLTLDQIEQQKEQTQKDYIKEQSAAYVDWQKQSNPYGVNAEKMASAGLSNSGYSESSQVAMYNQYQKRVGTARESLQQAIVSYNNMAAEARMQNSELMQQIADSFLEQSMKLSIEGALYNNQLITELMARQDALRAAEQAEWNSVYDRLWAEESMKYDVWKYQDNQKFTAEQAQMDRDHQERLQTLDQEFEAKENQLNREHDAAQAELDRKHDKELLAAKNKQEKEMAEINYQNEKKLLAEKLANEKALLDYEYQKKKTAITGSSGGSGSGSSGGSYSSAKVGIGTSSSSAKGNPYVTNQKTNYTTKTPINKESVLALGKPYSEAELADLVSEGKVISYVKDGELHFRWNPTLPSFKIKNGGTSSGGGSGRW